MLDSKRKQRVGNPSETLMYVQRYGRSWCWNKCWLGCAGCMLQIHTPTHLSFWGILCQGHSFWCQLPLTSAKLFSCVPAYSFLGIIYAYCPLHQRVSESDGGAHIAENHTPPPPTRSQNVTPWIGLTVWNNNFLVRKSADSKNFKNG